MKKGLNEKKTLKELGVSKATEITEKQIPILSRILPDINPEIAKNILKQIPEFTKLATGIVDNYKEIIINHSKSNDESMKAYFSACNKILSSLEKELNKKFISPKRKEKIIDKMIEIADKMDRKDTENKHMILKRDFGIAAFFATILGLLVTVLTLGRFKFTK